jgi:hypothetical protein
VRHRWGVIGRVVLALFVLSPIITAHLYPRPHVAPPSTCPERWAAHQGFLLSEAPPGEDPAVTRARYVTNCEDLNSAYIRGKPGR